MCNHTRFVVLVVAVLSFASATPGLVGSASAATEPTPIDSCTTITEPGEYVLTDDIEDVSEPGCIRITVSNVTLDGDGERIEGTWARDGIPFSGDELVDNERSLIETNLTNAAIVIDPSTPAPNETATPNETVTPNETATNETATPNETVTPNETATNGTATPNETVTNETVTPNETAISNVTVTDVTVTDWLMGVFVGDAAGTTLQEVTARNNGYGTVLHNATNTAIRDGDVTNNVGLGIVALASDDTMVSDTTSDENEHAGMLLSESDNGTITDSDVSENGRDGIVVHSSDGGLVFESTVERNEQDGINATNVTNLTVRNVIASNNEFVGVSIRDSRSSVIAESTIERNEMGVTIINSPMVDIQRSVVTGNDVVNVFIR